MNKILTLALCSILSACEQYQPPDPNGPKGSWWVGGLDGGAYIYIEDDANTNDNIYQGSIYFDADKTLWYRGKFQYSKNSPLDYKNKQLYAGWDGERLHLKDNSFLKALDEIPQL